MSVSRRRLLTGAMAGLAALPLAACGEGGAGTGDSAGGMAPIRIALDWTPNTNHTGLFVAAARGFFASAGIAAEFLPYNSTSPDTLVDSGAAEFGISFHDSAVFSRTAGADIVSVYAPLQHWATAIGVRADRADITRPRDLDGATYAGFGGPGEGSGLRQVIINDGGTGDFETVTLGTSAYEAVYSGAADVTIPFVAWEGIEAQRAGTPFKYFRYTDFGFPDAYAVLIVGNGTWLRENPELARAFVGAVDRGYRVAQSDPAAAAEELISANPGMFPDPELVRQSQAMLAADYMLDASGAVGRQSLAQWTEYPHFLFAAGLLAGEDGSPPASEPEWGEYFTNDYLPEPAEVVPG